MKIIKKGKIVSAPEGDISFDGESAKGWVITVAKEDGQQGYYIYYKNPAYKDRGYDGWHLTLEEVDHQLKYEIERGWEIEWEN